MATIDNAIVIDDDDDHDEHYAVLSQEQQDSVQLLMEILHIMDRSYAWRQLQAAGFDLQLALSRLLYSQPSTATATATTTTTASAAVPPEEEKRDSKPIFGSPKTSISKENVDHTRTDDINNSRVGVVSDPWQGCLEDSDSPNTPFVDPDFPPTRTSLDGRREGSSTLTTPNVVLCLCKLPAAARTVQSDGPNYGRFYLGCGQKNQRRQLRRRQNKTDNSLDSCSDPPPIKPCNFFQWDKDGSKGGAGDYSAQWPQMAWHSFVGPEYVLYHKQMCPDQIRQGAVGNCWFLSALAVVAEKPYLVQKLVPHSHQTPNKNRGGYHINLCLDGKWTTVIVDSNLPVVYSQQKEKAPKKQSSSLSLAKKQEFRGGAILQGGTVVAYPAFCAIPRGQLWSALVEKAYAKAHGSYANLSGGFIAEGLADLTGAPCETIVLYSHHLRSEKQELWARMLSFSEAGFLLGVATSQGGDGLVGGHAYSILAVQEIHGSLVGAQPKVTDFFVNPKTKKQKVNKNNEPKQQQQRETIRLVRIRNPWGKKEWKGAWSVNSETWTNRLRQKLGDNAWAKDDGTFWMSFDDILDRFHHMDVCKTREVRLRISIVPPW
jgi:calpain-15